MIRCAANTPSWNGKHNKKTDALKCEVVLICRICGNSTANIVYIAREMLIGTREEFDYFECASCGCLQIAEIPSDLKRYYPEGYYSFRQLNKDRRERLYMSFLRNKRDAYLLQRSGIIGRLLQSLRPAEHPYALLGQIGNVMEKSVLDVGCGSGMFLLRLQELGVRNLLGIDPFIHKDIEYADGLMILKKTIAELVRENGRSFDVILFNHSFEHMSDPCNVLQEAAKLLNDSGQIIINIPTVTSYVWKHYQTNWVQLDAPRHLHLLSVPALRLLADRAGFVIDDVIYNSNVFQFWGSELYARDIPMALWGDLPANFTKSEIRRFKANARTLNEKNLGDQAAFYLKKK